MRQFVFLGHEAPTDPDFSLDDLPGAGRLDLLCRCITSGLLLSHGIREETRVHVVCRDELTVRFDGHEIRNLRPDERSTAALLRTALEARDEAVGHVEAEPAPGVSVARRGFESILGDLSGTVVHLHEDGDPVSAVEPPADPVFVLSDHRDFTDAEEAVLSDAADSRIRLGPKRLHADQATTVAHNWVDTAGYTSY